MLSTLTNDNGNAKTLGYVSAVVVLSPVDLAGRPEAAVTRALFEVRAELRKAARERGGDAVLGVRTSQSAAGSAWVVLAEGTAVRGG